MASVLKSRKGQAGLPMNYTVIGVIVVLVLAGVFYAIIKSEAVRKLRELPLQEEEVEEMVEMPGVCSVKAGYVGKSDFYGGDEEYLYTTTKTAGGDRSSVNPFFIYDENKLYYHVDWWFDFKVGVIEAAGNQILRFYCDAKERVSEKGQVQNSWIYDYFNGGYFIKGIGEGGRQTICKDNRTYTIFECSGGTELMNRMISRILTMPVLSLKRGNQEIVRIKDKNANAKESAKFQITELHYLSSAPGREINTAILSDFPYAATDTTHHRRELGLVWDECQQKAFVISYLNGYYQLFAWSDYELMPYFSRIRIRDREVRDLVPLLFKEFFREQILGEQLENKLLLNISYVLNAGSRVEFAKRLAEFTIMFCNESKDRENKIGGWQDKWQGSVGEGECSGLAGLSKEQALAYINRTFFNPALKYECNKYECLFDKKWEECKIINDWFCSVNDDKKCILYAWNDKFELLDTKSGAKISYTLLPDYNQA